MPIFMTRVELYGIEPAAPYYIRLGEEMVRRKFSRMAPGSDGLPYHLPGLYYSYGNLSAEEVRELAAEAAGTVGFAVWPGRAGFIGSCGIVVAQVTRLSWAGLQKPDV